jgi:betaine lipid synthase
MMMAMLIVGCSVNMYASTWICTKEVGLEHEHEHVKVGSSTPRLRKTSLAELKLEAPALRVE